MKELISLRLWALAVIIVPTAVIGLILGTVLTYQRYTELDQNLIERGIFLSEPLSLASADALANDQQEQLLANLEAAHLRASPMVKSISVFLPSHELYVSTNLHRDFGRNRLVAGRLISDSTEVDVAEHVILIRSPIYGVTEAPSDDLFVQKLGKTLYGYLVVELSKEQAQLAQQSSLYGTIALLVSCLIVTLIIAWFFIDNIISPLGRLTGLVQKISLGDTKARDNVAMLGELNDLRLGIHNLAKVIYLANEKAEHNISEYTQELQQTVELLEVQNIELNMAKREAQDASEVKSQFLANMSHELRTPLNGVLGFTRQLRKTPLNANQLDFLDTIESSANNLLRIINDILDFSKLDAGKMELESIPFSIRETVNEVMTLLAPAVFDKGLELHLRIDNRIPDNMQGDPVRLKQVLTNLIGNAIKFTRQGFIRLEVNYLGSRPQGQHLKFTVSDSGVGIEASKQDKLFAAFGQADNSTTRKYGGTGLGLIISQRLVQAMDGSIHFNSEENKGSEFYFDVYLNESAVEVNQALPLHVLDDKRILYFDTCLQAYNDVREWLSEETRVELKTTSDEQEFNKLVATGSYDMVLIGRKVSASNISELKRLISQAVEKAPQVYVLVNTISPNIKEVLISSGAKTCLSMPINHRKWAMALIEPFLIDDETVMPKTANFNGMKVLAVDDNEANLKLISALLTDLNTEVDTAVDGQQALELCRKNHYDIVFMDIQMPIMDGSTACQKIRADSINELTPIIAVTAHVRQEQWLEFEQQGFSGLLTKPIDEEMLNQVLLEACPTCVIYQSKTVLTSDATVIEHPALDWHLALERANGKAALAAELWQSFLTSLPETLQLIKLNYEQGQVDNLIKVVHKFHGSCCYTGVPKLRTLASVIESGLKNGQKVDDVEPELLELIDELTNILELIEAA